MMTLKSEQIIRNINISILTDEDMDSDIKEIYDTYQKFCGNLYMGRIFNDNNSYGDVIVNDNNSYGDVIVNENKEPICLFSNDATNLHICDDFLYKLRVDLSSHSLDILYEDINYLLKHFLKEKFPTIFKHKLEDMYVYKTGNSQFKSLSKTSKIELLGWS